MDTQIRIYFDYNGLAYSKHVMQGDVLRNGYDERDFGFYCLFNCGRGLVGCHVDGRGIRLQLLHRLSVMISALDRYTKSSKGLRRPIEP